MASLKGIKGRMKSIDSTKQITNAMNLVATAKLSRSKEGVTRTRPFFEKVQETINSIVSHTKGVSHPFVKNNGVDHSTFIVLASDRGLCGGYNVNVCKLALQNMEQKKNIKLVTVGKRTRDFFKARKVKIDEAFEGISENPHYTDAVRLAETAINDYREGKTGEVYLVYTAFLSTIQQEPRIIRLLPLDPKDFETEKGEKLGMVEYEPSPEAVLDYVVPKYVASVIYGGMIESAASEQGARMTAMDSATENAEEMMDKLTIEYNRARQAAITQELSEIVGGAEALK